MALTNRVALRRNARRPEHSRRNGRRRAFVVEDDPDTRHLLGEFAGELGWEARRFANLHAVRSALSDERPDVIILDDDLPDGRGGDFAVEVRSDARLRRTPIIFCTGVEPERRREIGRIAPVLGKPFDLDRLEALLEDVAGAA